MPARSSTGVSRVETAHRALQELLRGALKEHDQYGHGYLDPKLCNAVAHFSAEVLGALGSDEIRRRAEIPKEQTSEGTPYAKAMADVVSAGLKKYVPMMVAKGGMPGHSNTSFICEELAGVRRLLGPVGDKGLTEPQKIALRAWERELEMIDADAIELHTDGCQWLLHALEYHELLRNGTPFPTERPTAEYNDAGQVVMTGEGFTLSAGAIRQMQTAAESLVAGVAGSGRSEAGKEATSGAAGDSQTKAELDGSAGQVGGDSTKVPPVKRPSENAMAAWRLRDLRGINSQTELALKMTQQGVPATQGQVSRWLRDVEKYLEAGNILPDLKPMRRKPDSVDPAVIEMGQRHDKRTPRQRPRRDPDSDE